MKKINWLLILQGWTMLWVVIGHAFLGAYNKGPEWETMLCKIAYSFHMPLFMLISGWLFYPTRLKMYALKPDWGEAKSVNGERLEVNDKRWTYRAIVKDKVIRLLLPGVVFSLVAFAVKIAVPGEVSRQTGFSLGELGLAFLYPYDNPFREFWFIATLFWFFLMTPLWKGTLEKRWLMWVMVIVLIVLHFYRPETNFLSIDRVCTHAIWFYMGLVISKGDWVKIVFDKKPLFTSVVGIVVYIIGLFTEWAILKTVGGITFSFGLALLLDRYMPQTFFSFRNYTYQIFLIGIFAQMFVKIMYKHISMPYMVAYIFCILMGLYVPVFVSKILEWINLKPLSLCVGLKSIRK